MIVRLATNRKGAGPDGYSPLVLRLLVIVFLNQKVLLQFLEAYGFGKRIDR